MSRARQKSTYEQWIDDQGVPIVRAYGVEDVLELPRGRWERLDGRGTIIKLEGMEGETGMYVAEISPGGVLKPEKHLYEEIFYVLRGRGSGEVWSPGSQSKALFEWQEGSMFAMPLNAWHQFANGSGSEPAILLAYTDAPIVLDLFHDPRLIFESDYVADDRFGGQADYFSGEGTRHASEVEEGTWLWHTNFVPNVFTAILDEHERKGVSTTHLQYEFGEGILVTHISEWPTGLYHKAHYHGAGAVLLTLRGVGYTLVWPNEMGIRPYETGNADQVVRVNCRPGSVVSPPSGWFHQHFNTGPDSVRHLAFRMGTHRYGVEFHDIRRREGVLISVKEGGTMIEYADEDPEIRRQFEAECTGNEVQVTMRPVAAIR